LEFGVWSVELSGYSVSLCYFEKTVILRSVATKNLSGTTTFLKKIPHYVRDDIGADLLWYFKNWLAVILRSVATKNLSGTTTFLKKIPHYVRDDSQLVILRNLAYMLF